MNWHPITQTACDTIALATYHRERRVADWPDALLLEHANAWARAVALADAVMKQTIADTEPAKRVYESALALWVFADMQHSTFMRVLRWRDTAKAWKSAREAGSAWEWLRRPPVGRP